MAAAFNLRDVDPDAIIADQRQGEGKGGDRGISLKIIDEVLSNTRNLFQEEGLGDDIAQKLKTLWISKLEACGESIEKNDPLSANTNTATSKGHSITEVKNTEGKINSQRRKKGQKKTSLYSKEEAMLNIDEIAGPSTPQPPVLLAPKSVISHKRARIGGQLDGPNDTSDEEEDIGNVGIILIYYSFDPTLDPLYLNVILLQFK